MQHRRRRQRRRGLRATVTLVLLAAAGVAAGVVMTNSHATGEEPPLFYLDIGASASLGVQPNGVIGHNGAFTKWGYGDDVVRLEAARGVSVKLAKIGCMGETAQSLAGAGDHCYTLPSTQLTTAVGFLHAHRNDYGIVSIDVGFNNLRPCLWVVPLAGQCASQGLASVRQNMPAILSTLKSAAGPHVHFVGLTYADPFLYRYTKGGQGVQLARQSLTYMSELDAALTTAYRSADIPVADVAAAFKSADTASTTLAPFGQVPVDVSEVCRMTWMCAARPFGPDDHPNKAGYMLIARTILSAVPSQL
jgi:hypothetical protein